MPSSSFFSGTNPTPTEYENAVDLVAQATAQAQAALASQTAAETAALSSQGYSVSAGTSAGTATTQASSASTSATNAASSATSASTSATSASSSATAASSSASSASTSATNASNSATSAAGSATTAGTYATNAANSATAAANSASDATATLANALTKSDNLASLSNASTARTNLGVAIGSNVQAWDADLDAIAAISSTSGLLKKTAANTWTLDTTSYLSGVVGLSNGGTGATDATGARSNLGLGTAATAASTSFLQVANNLSDLNSASSARTNLGLGSVATLASSAVLQSANNLSDLASNVTARTNLGLTALATTTPGTGVATALGVNTGTAGAFVVNGAALGTPSSGTLTNCTGLPAAGVTGLATVATTGAYSSLSGTPSLATVATTGAYSDLSGKPTLGSLAALSSINNSNWSGTQLSVANGGTGLTSLTAGYIPYGNGTGAFGVSNIWSDGTNVGIGTNSPTSTAGFIPRLQVTSSSATGIVITGGGTSQQSVVASNGSGLYIDCAGNASGASNNIIFRTAIGNSSYGADERLRITSAGDVLIGTTSTGGILRAYGASGRLIIGDSGYNYYDANTHNFRNYAGTVNMQLTSDGNLGLGVTPSAWSALTGLQVKNAALSGYQNDMYLTANSYYGSGGNTYIASAAATMYQQTAGTHKWYTAPSGTAGSAISFTQAMTLDSSGNLGINTTSPQYPLDVQQKTSDNDYALQLRGYTTGTDGARTVNIRTVSGNAGDWANCRMAASSFIWRYQSGSELARIDSSGNLLVGTTSTPTGNVSHILSSGSGSNRGSVILQRQTASTSGVAGSIQAYNGSNLICSYDMYADGANNSGGIQVFTWNAGAASGGPYVSKGGTSWTTASDISLKDITGEINNALDKVSKLRCVYYTLKDDETKKERVGFVAQEMNDVLPQVVDTDRNGKLGIAYPSVAPLLSAAIKELSAKLDAAEARIAALEH